MGKPTKKIVPGWYDESKLKKVYYAPGYSGWVIDCGDGTCRYTNSLLLGADPGLQEDGTTLTREQCDEINRNAPRWGDRVKWGVNGMPDPTKIVERWQPELYDDKGKRKKSPDDLERTEELFEFLKGIIPEGYKIRPGHMPKLTPDQAWTVIWYLGNQYWQVTDHIERCCVCGNLYGADCEGDYLDYGKAPYHFCETCMTSEEYWRKVKSRLNPDKEKRKEALSSH